MEIRCKKGDCKHNTGCSCAAKEVEISKSTDCKSFVQDEIKKDLIIKNGNIFKVTEEMEKKNTRSVPLECHAKSCLYNRRELCHANGITVIDPKHGEKPSDCADCATFIEE